MRTKKFNTATNELAEHFYQELTENRVVQLKKS